jgi:ribonuclease HI
VRQDILVAQRFGRAPQTTNNRMELTALMAAYEIIDEHAPNEEVVIWSDSQLVVNTLTKWAPAWERNGWRRRGGPVKNLDLVKPLYDLARAHPRATVKWLRGHHGSRWNEYVDMLATAPL